MVEKMFTFIDKINNKMIKKHIIAKTTKSKNNIIKSINIIDSPGLHDLTENYNYQIEQAINEFGKIKDFNLK